MTPERMIEIGQALQALGNELIVTAVAEAREADKAEYAFEGERPDVHV